MTRSPGSLAILPSPKTAMTHHPIHQFHCSARFSFYLNAKRVVVSNQQFLFPTSPLCSVLDFVFLILNLFSPPDVSLWLFARASLLLWPPRSRDKNAFEELGKTANGALWSSGKKPAPRVRKEERPSNNNNYSRISVETKVIFQFKPRV
jgi:hypothetical protein